MKKLLLFACILLTVEILGIVGYYWLFEGYAGNFELTISRYVGLNWLSAIIFLIGNLGIIALVMVYMFDSGIKNFLWRLLIGIFAVCFLCLSICPHVPNNDQIIFIHRFFAGGLFIAFLLLAMLTTGLTQNKLAKAFCFAYIVYGVYFLVSYINTLPNYVPGVFIYEALYIYGGLAILACASPTPKAINN